MQSEGRWRLEPPEREGELVAVLQDDRGTPIHWYQRSGAVRKLRDPQVFLIAGRRTRVTVVGDRVFGPRGLPEGR